MPVTQVTGGRHFCPLPRFMDQFEHHSGKVFRCDDCGRYWRLRMGGNYHAWSPVGWWESRKIRRANERQPASAVPSVAGPDGGAA